MLPKGTVAFLFTDIEGSTRLWEGNPDAMQRAVSRHDEIVRDAVEASDGTVFKAVGDGILAVFVSPRAAISAAVRAQRALGSENWPTETPIRVRMAVHCGTTTYRDGDYFGPVLNRCARIEDLAHGGQILVSQAAYALTRDDLPEAVSLHYVGEHPLRDLSRPERLYQLRHPDLPTEFPAPRSLERLPNNLPVRLSRFVGRVAEVGAVRQMVRESRLVSLVGAGGTGKTRLALQAAADVLVDWPDGAWLVDLAPLGDPLQIYPAIAAAVGIGEERGRSFVTTITDALRPRRLLLILDNCEHLILECAHVADHVLTSCPGVTLLATSREALGIAGEVCYRVPPLAVPPPGAAGSPEDLAEYEAIQLFVDRAQEAQTGFALSDDNVSAVAEICRRLDGIPLALELAAARLPLLSPHEVATRLDRRFQLLTGGSRVALPRQQTLRAAVDWSYDLLSRREQAVMAALSVFASGCTLAAAEVVCADDEVPQEEVMDVALQLAAKSLVAVTPGPRGTRYSLTQTMRDYAREKLLQSGQVEAVRDRHLQFVLDEVARMERLPDGPDLADRLARLDLEHDNIRAALGWAALRGETGSVLEIAVGMAKYWTIRGHWREGRAHLERVPCEVGEAVTPRLRADVLGAIAGLARHQGDARTAEAAYAEALAIRRALGDASGVADALNGLGNLAFGHGRLEQAASLFAESLASARASGDALFAAGVLGNLANVALRLHDLDTALARHEESLSIRRRLGDRRGTAIALVNIGNVAYHQGRWEDARACHEESLAIRREIGDKAGTATALLNLCTALSELGALEAAHDCAAESLAIARSLRDPVGIAFALCNLAEVEIDQGDIATASCRLADSLRVSAEIGDLRVVPPAVVGLAEVAARRTEHELALRLLSAADAHLARLGAPSMPQVRKERMDLLDRCSQALAPSDIAEAQAAGRSMSLDDILSEASALAELAHRPGSRPVL